MKTDSVDVHTLKEIFPSLTAEGISVDWCLQNLKMTLDKEALVTSDLFYLSMMIQHEDLMLAERAQLDWTFFDLKNQPEMNYQLEAGILFLPPDVKILKLNFEQPFYRMSDGIWGFRVGADRQIIQKKIEAQHAEIFDLLSEDRKFSERQLLDQLIIKEDEVLDLTRVLEYKAALTELIDSKFILKT